MVRSINWPLHHLGRIPQIILYLWEFLCVRDTGRDVEITKSLVQSSLSTKIWTLIHFKAERERGICIHLGSWKQLSPVNCGSYMHLCHAWGPLIKYLFVSEISSKYEKVEALSKALLELPPSHYETLKYLLGHLYR